MRFQERWDISKERWDIATCADEDSLLGVTTCTVILLSAHPRSFRDVGIVLLVLLVVGMVIVLGYRLVVTVGYRYVFGGGETCTMV